LLFDELLLLLSLLDDAIINGAGLGSTDNDEDTDKGGRNGTDAGVELRMGVF
jgi:hypothetical protein